MGLFRSDLLLVAYGRRWLVDLGWLYGDVIAGLTVGIVVVPQSMSYAQVCLLLFFLSLPLIIWADCYAAA